jgi:hypothetical protein
MYPRIQAVEGVVKLIRLNEVGSGYGPHFDRLDMELILAVDSYPDLVIGLPMRGGPAEAVHWSMLTSLRAAFRRGSRVRLEYLTLGAHVGELRRVLM